MITNRLTATALASLTGLVLTVQPARAGCAELQLLASDYARELHLRKSAIQDIQQQIAAAETDADREALTQELGALRAEHRTIIGKIELAGKRIKTECAADE